MANGEQERVAWWAARAYMQSNSAPRGVDALKFEVLCPPHDCRVRFRNDLSLKLAFLIMQQSTAAAAAGRPCFSMPGLVESVVCSIFPEGFQCPRFVSLRCQSEYNLRMSFMLRAGLCNVKGPGEFMAN